jgi:hypothetical protein
MKKRSVLVVSAMLIMAAFLSVSGAYADTMFAAGGTVFFQGSGAGTNLVLPQVGYMSAKRHTISRIATRQDENLYGVLEGRHFTKYIGWDYDDFDYSILFDLTMGFGIYPDVLNISAGLTVDFYFLPELLWIYKIGAGIGGGWGLIGLNQTLFSTGDDWPKYGAPYIRASIPILLGTFKTGVYYDYYLMDDPYTQFNIVLALMF